MSGAPGNLALDGGDPRRPSDGGIGESETVVTRHDIQKLHDPSVTFEEYVHYAKISRADTRYEDPERSYRFWERRKTRNATTAVAPVAQGEKSLDEKDVNGGSREGHPAYMNVSDEEYVNASRAVRTATWGAVFYLITTDILGPYTTP